MFWQVSSTGLKPFILRLGPRAASQVPARKTQTIGETCTVSPDEILVLIPDYGFRQASMPHFLSC